MDDLIARLEKANEGSQELSAEIAIRCFPQKWRYKYDAIVDGAPDFSRSIDAAMTLVPDGLTDHDIDITRSIRGKLTWEYWTLWQVRISIESAYDDTDETSGQYIGRAMTLPLALCSAALKARTS